MPTYTPADPGYEARVRESFSVQNAMTTIGVEIVSLSPGKIELSMPYSDRFTQQNGFVHAGIISTALDSACGYAAFSLMPSNASVLTIEFKSNLVAPARGGLFRFFGHVVKPGRTITVCEAQCYADSEGNEKLVATMSATLMAITNRPI